MTKLGHCAKSLKIFKSIQLMGSVKPDPNILTIKISSIQINFMTVRAFYRVVIKWHS